MAAFPQLNEEDFSLITQSLDALRAKTAAHMVLLVEKAGYLIHESGAFLQCDATQLATLAANSYNATQFIASLIDEKNFTTMVQQGSVTNLMILNIDENCILVVLFKSSITAGSIKFYAAKTIGDVADQLRKAGERAPESSISLIDLNPTDLGDLFKRR